MAKLLKGNAELILENHLPKIQRCVESGFDDYIKKYPVELRMVHEVRTKAGNVRDHIVAKARNEFEGTIGVSIIENNNLFILDFEGALLLRFKKLKKNLLPSNYPTKQQICFDFQNENAIQNELAGIPANLPILTAGYVPNCLWTGIDEVSIVYAYGGKIEWNIDLMADESNVLILDTNATKKITNISKRAKLKTSKKNKKVNDDEG